MKGILAAIIMFTRLPLGKWVKIEKEYYSTVLNYWPLIGFITGTTTWGVLFLSSCFLPAFPACILAIIARVLLTGALHEDGLADFFDGFGGGNSKEKILNIMKDSHIGSFGTIGLILYFIFYTAQLQAINPNHLIGVIIGADVLSKLCTTLMINTLNYARNEEQSKNKIIYKKIPRPIFIGITIFCFAVLWFLNTPLLAIIPVCIILIGFRQYLKQKIGGYTGDCCGAIALLTEQSFYLSCSIYYSISSLS